MRLLQLVKHILIRTIEGNAVERALGEHEISPFRAAHDDGHHLARGRERDLPHFLVLLAQMLVVDALRLGEGDDRRLRGIADDLFLPVVVPADGCRAGKGELLQKAHLLPVKVRVLGHGLGAVHPEPLDGHFVHGERARLVRTDDGGTAQRLHRLHLPDERVLCRHLLGALR